jgi:hypothetical protein
MKNEIYAKISYYGSAIAVVLFIITAIILKYSGK